MTSTFSSELDFAREVATIGGQVAMKRWLGELQTDRKPDGTWVTDADVATEDAIRNRLAQSWPQHNILGEEAGLTSASGGAPIDGAPTWVVDPIDATHNYMFGIPIWATLVALVVDENPVVGVCHAPALNETYDAARGAGARMNGQAISVSKVRSLDDAHVITGSMASFAEHGLETFVADVTHRAWRSRGFGDFWGHMLVARGAAHIMLEPAWSLWDYAALQPIIEEAGGRITQISGAPLADGGSALTTNGDLHDEILALARRIPEA
jgi:histidinol-phosphatase